MVSPKIVQDLTKKIVQLNESEKGRERCNKVFHFPLEAIGKIVLFLAPEGG